ncbi:hypothetical protein K2173_006882 [Erythroxylum novogranatense]|uniref:Uncharacterized protein n=1 Tax=Erythroxylum novogranatense TaxID=1862640 RepID=A0AAV8SY71_9ROSI|nr:hypothetical protein K2173_006882 [Erythroxylum novogranatense]
MLLASPLLRSPALGLPDCSMSISSPVAVAGGSEVLIAATKAIEADSSLTVLEKPRRRQKLLSQGAASSLDGDDNGNRKIKIDNNLLDLDRDVPLDKRTCEGRRTLRARKNVMKCPTCTNGIADFLQNPQVNTQLMDVIESLKKQTAEMEESEGSAEESSATQKTTDTSVDTDDSDESCTMLVDDNLKDMFLTCQMFIGRK